jgi:hypothetical protein
MMNLKLLPFSAICIVLFFSLGCENGNLEADMAEGSEPITVTLTTTEGDSINVQAEIVDGLVIAEGDMILGSVSQLTSGEQTTFGEQSFRMNKALGVSYSSSMWPNAQVPYTISSSWDSEGREKIELAVSLFNRDSPVKYVPRTNQYSYVRFEKSTENNSYVGNHPNMGLQPINLSYTQTDNVLHEMGHAVGLYHEHQRPDRENYVSVREPYESRDPTNFKILTQNISTYNTPFDYASIMLYDTYLTRKDDGEIIVFNNDYSLSTLDVIGIARMYNLPPIVRYNERRAGDFNGDGLSDVLFTWGDGTLHVALTQKVGSVYKVANSTEWITKWGHAGGMYHLGDFNGDGKTDVMFIEPGNDSINVAISTGSSFKGAGGGPWIDQERGLWGTVRYGGQYRVGDFNGDKKDDLLFFEPADNSIHVAISTGYDFYGSGTGRWIGPDGFGDFETGQYLIGNFDGDDYDDLLYTSIYTRKYYVTLSTGYSFGKAGSDVWYDADDDDDYFLMDPSISSKTITTADMDNDGDDDLVFWATFGKHFRVARSNESSFDPSETWTTTLQANFDGGEFLFGEFTGDTEKQVDVIVRFEKNNNFKVIPNWKGLGFDVSSAYEFIPPNGFGDVSSTSVYR